MRYYAERVISDLDAIRATRTLTVVELDSRRVALWLIAALAASERVPAA